MFLTPPCTAESLTLSPSSPLSPSLTTLTFLALLLTFLALLLTFLALLLTFLALLLTFLVLHHSSSCSSIFTPLLALLPETASSLPSYTVESCHLLLTIIKGLH